MFSPFSVIINSKTPFYDHRLLHWNPTYTNTKNHHACEWPKASKFVENHHQVQLFQPRPRLQPHACQLVLHSLQCPPWLPLSLRCLVNNYCWPYRRPEQRPLILSNFQDLATFLLWPIPSHFVHKLKSFHLVMKPKDLNWSVGVGASALQNELASSYSSDCIIIIFCNAKPHSQRCAFYNTQIFLLSKNGWIYRCYRIVTMLFKWKSFLTYKIF